MLNPKYGSDFEDPVADPGMKSGENLCNFMKFTIFHLLIIIMILMFRAFSLMQKYILYTFIVPLTLYPQFFILGVIQSMEEAQ